MARLVAAFGTSHSPMMIAAPETWADGSYIARDSQRALFDLDGRQCDYPALLARAPAGVVAQLAAQTVIARHTEVQAGLRRLREDIAAARLDALIVIGDDQHELFNDHNMPAIGIFYGSSIRNGCAETDPALVYPEPDYERQYPCHGELARFLIACIMERGFDVAAMDGLAHSQSEGHAFSFVHRFLMGSRPVPIVPLFLNAYYEPNQPSPGRCFDLGVALAAAIKAFPVAARIAIIASGGLSHFVVDEVLDHSIVAALRDRNNEFLRGLPLSKLKSGSSEIRNWICLAGAVASLKSDWITYVPGYRTPALTGTGLCLASFKEGDTLP